MEEYLHMVTEWLLCASSQIGHEYFQLPVAGMEEPIYRERVYCYELYHKWRCQWPEGFHFSLGGEIDKNGHPKIRNKSKPDFLVHIPGQMVNLLIVEVKPINGDIDEMVGDLEKLTYFRREIAENYPNENYTAAYFWIYGSGDFDKIIKRLLEKARENPQIALSLIRFFWHREVGEQAVEISIE